MSAGSSTKVVMDALREKLREWVQIGLTQRLFLKKSAMA